MCVPELTVARAESPFHVTLMQQEETAGISFASMTSILNTNNIALIIHESGLDNWHEQILKKR